MPWAPSSLSPDHDGGQAPDDGAAVRCLVSHAGSRPSPYEDGCRALHDRSRRSCAHGHVAHHCCGHTPDKHRWDARPGDGSSHVGHGPVSRRARMQVTDSSCRRHGSPPLHRRLSRTRLVGHHDVRDVTPCLSAHSLWLLPSVSSVTSVHSSDTRSRGLVSLSTGSNSLTGSSLT